MTTRICAAVPVYRTFGVELLEALLVRRNASVAPYLFALKIKGGAETVEAITVLVAAWTSVFLVYVVRALSRFTGTHLG